MIRIMAIAHGLFYGLCHAGELITLFRPMKIITNEVPTDLNPLGAKGGGEAGTVGLCQD